MDGERAGLLGPASPPVRPPPPVIHSGLLLLQHNASELRRFHDHVVGVSTVMVWVTLAGGLV